MNFGVVLAGGTGTRMGADKPKQFLEIGGKPIIVHTVEKFALYKNFEKVIVLTPEEWIEHTKDVLEKHIDDMSRVVVIKGGAVRNETIMNSIRYIEENYGLDEDSIIVTHDAVRPFVTYRIIDENIEAAGRYGACDTVVPATDTIIETDDKETICSIPDRSRLYNGQTPQSFRVKELKETYEALTDAEKDILTDACKIYVMKDKPVYLVKGETFNIKVTYPYDLKVAEVLLGNEK